MASDQVKPPFDVDIEQSSYTKSPSLSQPTSSGSAEDIPPSYGSQEEDAYHTDKLVRNLSARQVQMIAIGGTIGTGLFLGTGKSLSTGGPASMLISYAICGAIVFTTMMSLGEMAAFMPVAGAFCTYSRYARKIY